jgi:hypothetical protein
MLKLSIAILAFAKLFICKLENKKQKLKIIIPEVE